MTVLERRYRRMLRVLPRWYRAEREEEMVSAFLEDVNRDPDADLRHDFGWPGWGEFGSLIALSARTRWPGRTGSPRALVKGQVVRLVALIGLLLGSASSLNHWLSRVAPELYAVHYITIDGYVTGPVQYAWDWRAVLGAALDAGTVLTFLALLVGARWLARSGAIASLLVLGALVVDALSGSVIVSSSTAVYHLVGMVYALCVLAGFHQDAPPVKARWWLAALAVLVAMRVSVGWVTWLALDIYVLIAAAVYLVVHYRVLWRAPAAWLQAVAAICGLTVLWQLVRLPVLFVGGLGSVLGLAIDVAEVVVLVALGLWFRAQAAKVLPPETRSPLTVAG